MTAGTQRAPRITGSQTSMSLASEAIRSRYADDSFAGPALRIFDTVPPRHCVIAAVHDAAILRAGEVAVYDQDAPAREGLVEGAIYVIENQRPRSSMPMWMWRELSDPRMDVQRSIIIARRHSTLVDRWAAHPMRMRQRGGFVMNDGPYEEGCLTDKIIGRVIGIYQPAAFAVVS